MANNDMDGLCGSAVGHDWHMDNGDLIPTFFEGPTAAETLHGLMCSCHGRTPCRRGCQCVDNNIPSTSLCG